MSKILRPKSTADKTGVPVSSLYEMARKGNFPKPIKLSARRSGFLENEVDEWIAECVASREEQSGKAVSS